MVGPYSGHTMAKKVTLHVTLPERTRIEIDRLAAEDSEPGERPNLSQWITRMVREERRRRDQAARDLVASRT